MAWFKSRKQKVDEPVAASSPAESIEAMRRRARHRLIGAAVLVLAAVVGFSHGNEGLNFARALFGVALLLVVLSLLCGRREQDHDRRREP